MSLYPLPIDGDLAAAIRERHRRVTLTSGEVAALAYLDVISWHVEKAMPARLRLALASLAERGLIETRDGGDDAGRRVRLPLKGGA